MPLTAFSHRRTCIVPYDSNILFIELTLLLQVPNNYETDLIYPIIEKAAELANVSYALADDSTKMNLKVLYHSRICNLFPFFS